MRLLFQTDDYPGARNPRVVLGLTEVVLGKGATAIACLSHLKTGEQFDTAYFEGGTAAFGWCAHSAQHDRCPGFTVGPKGQVTTCTCEHHQTPMTNEEILLHDDRRRCRVCSDYLDPKRMGRGGDPICSSQEQCAQRRKELLRTNAKLAERAALDVLREDTMSTTTKEKTPRAKAEPKAPKTGICEFTGKATKGGRFTPGGDAKLKGALLEVARGEKADAAVGAVAELIARSWPTKSVAPAIVKDADALLKGKDADAFVAARVKVRLAKVAKGTDPREAVTG